MANVALDSEGLAVGKTFLTSRGGEVSMNVGKHALHFGRGKMVSARWPPVAYPMSANPSQDPLLLQSFRNSMADNFLKM